MEDYGWAIVIGGAVLFIGFIRYLVKGGTSEEDRMTSALAEQLERDLELGGYGAPEGSDGRR